MGGARLSRCLRLMRRMKVLTSLSHPFVACALALGVAVCGFAASAPAVAQGTVQTTVPIETIAPTAPAQVVAPVQDTVVETVETVVVPTDETVLHNTVDEAASAHESGGMPQLDAGSWPAQLFWLSLIFAGFYFFLSRVALPRVATVLEERRDRIANDLDQAALLQKRGDEALAAYEQSLAEARHRASRIARDMRDEVSADTDKQTKALEAELAKKAAEAETRIQASRDAVMANVATIAADAAQAIVAQITGEAPERSRVESAVAGALN